jgi:hypothetical protein
MSPDRTVDTDLGKPMEQQKDKFTGYRGCLCTFIDVLGFRELVLASCKDEQAKSKVHTILKQFQRNYNHKGVPGDRSSKEAPLIVKAFSDSIVRIVPLNGDQGSIDLTSEITHEVIDLCGAQFDLLTLGILVRGGLAIGDLYWDANQIFGPALIRAYDLENNLAVYPRIVLDGVVSDHIRNEKCRFLSSDYVCQDFDGAWYVDYLGFYSAMLAPHFVFQKDDYHKPFEVFRSHIIQNLSNSETYDGTRVKQMWLTKYFNRIVAAVPPEFRDRWSHLTIPI